MKAFLNEVMRDHDADVATFLIVLALGDGREIIVSPGWPCAPIADPSPKVTDEYVQGSKTASTTAAVSAGPARKYLAEVSSEA
jgi:hypothetical protein